MRPDVLLWRQIFQKSSSSRVLYVVDVLAAVVVPEPAMVSMHSTLPVGLHTGLHCEKCKDSDGF
jgi:hypothetical protein